MASVCKKLNGIPNGCSDDVGLGGIKRAFFFDVEDIDNEELDLDTQEVDDLTLLEPAAEYVFKRNTAQHTTTPAIDLINGSTFYTHVVTLMFGRRKASKSVELQLLAEGQRYLGLVYQDANDQWWYVKDLQLTGGDETSGQAKADNSKYEVEFTSEWAYRAFELDEALALSLLIPVS
jgi:hypothetical protein